MCYEPYKNKYYQLLHVNFGGHYLFPNLRSQFNNKTKTSSNVREVCNIWAWLPLVAQY